MKLLYVLAVKNDRTISPSIGVYKKVKSQISCFRKAGIDAIMYEGRILPKGIRSIPFFSSSICWRNIQVSDDVEVLYIRYVLSDYQLIKALRRLKRIHPRLRIILEMPTYPYFNECKKDIKLLRDLFYRRFLKRYVDQIVAYTNFEKIYDVPVINIINGIDLEITIPRNPSNLDAISICSVANFSWWHGIDRLLTGLIDYYSNGGTRNITVTLIGPDNKTLSDLRRLSSNEYLKQRVSFTGPLDGPSLDEQYDKSNIAIECLGIFRKCPGQVSSSLKSREYLAKGIPLVYSGKIDIFMQHDYRYAFRVPDDESPVDINKLISFFDGIYVTESEKNVIDKIRTFACNTVSIERTFLPVVEYILNENGDK